MSQQKQLMEFYGVDWEQIYFQIMDVIVLGIELCMLLLEVEQIH